jgi:hypothetical protein
MSELTDTIYEMRIEEAADALVAVLGPMYMTNPKATVPKATLIPKVAQKAGDDRHKDGYHYQPAVENRFIKEPNEKFIEAHWSTICRFCAKEKERYIVWDNDGVRIGSLQEYEDKQGCIENIGVGVTVEHNRRAEIINKRGGTSVYLNVNILQLPEGEDENNQPSPSE